MRWLAELRSVVDERLARYLSAKREAAARLAPEAPELVRAVEALTLRGGKRLRPAILHAAFRAVAPDRDPAEVVDAAAALELLQTYLLIHDDWMDRDEERRGGAAVHAALRDAHGGDAHLGASLAILAGNLASACAWELITAGDREPDVDRRVRDVFLRMHQEVVYGQQLDLLATSDVSLMQQLKTGSYTLRGPLSLGAALGRATDAQTDALLAYGRPLGEAFQMRDDLLGTFGDEGATGKPTAGDLRAGKRTALIGAAEERGTDAQLAPLRAVLGDAAADAAAIAAAREALVQVGAKAAVEARLSTLTGQAIEALSSGGLHEPGVTMLRELAEALGARDR